MANTIGADHWPIRVTETKMLHVLIVAVWCYVLIVIVAMAIDGSGSACVVWVVFTIAWRLVGIGNPLGNGSSSSNTDGWDGTSAVVITTTTSIID